MTQRWKTEKPGADEHAPYYAGYVAEASGEDVLVSLDRQLAQVQAQLALVPAAREQHRYAAGKWSVREVIAHLSDSERVFAYRALWFARSAPGDLPGFDENAWVPASGADERTLRDLGDEFAAVRRATLAFARSLSDEQALRSGTANGKPMTARALLWIMAGHTEHHLRVLRERYL
jgi:uncharacterized damage-inducible protein DinB